MGRVTYVLGSNGSMMGSNDSGRVTVWRSSDHNEAPVSVSPAVFKPSHVHSASDADLRTEKNSDTGKGTE